MDKLPFSTVDEYIDMQPTETRAALERVRAAIRKALPAADECISYRIPAYKMNGSPVIYFAGWKKHYSLYPVSSDLVAALGSELAPYEISKGTIRFPLSEPVPVGLIQRIARFKGQEAAQRRKAKAAVSSAKR